ncbi:hypothetical protein WN48_02480 [Eufriesea mexicana]|nr:hypothetical protein WN48_02480 [Eufriesea mexicana]
MDRFIIVEEKEPAGWKIREKDYLIQCSIIQNSGNSIMASIHKLPSNQRRNLREERKQPGVMQQEVIDIFPRFKSVCKSQPTEPSHTMCTGVRARELFAFGTIKPFLWGSETTLKTVLQIAHGGTGRSIRHLKVEFFRQKILPFNDIWIGFGRGGSVGGRRLLEKEERGGRDFGWCPSGGGVAVRKRTESRERGREGETSPQTAKRKRQDRGWYRPGACQSHGALISLNRSRTPEIDTSVTSFIDPTNSLYNPSVIEFGNNIDNSTISRTQQIPHSKHQST